MLLAPPSEVSIPRLIRRCGQRPKASHGTFKVLFPLISTPSCESPPKPLTPPVTLRLETGKDIDHRTNTTVSRPGQFRVALRICGHPRGWLLLVGTGNLAGPTTDATVAQAPMSARQPDVAHAFSVPCRHSWRRPRPSEQTTGEEDHPLAAVFALLLRAAVGVQSTGARGASLKKKSGKCKTGLKAGPALSRSK